MHFKRLITSIFLILFITGSLYAENKEMSIGQVNEALKRADDIVIEIPELDKNSLAVKAAQEAADVVNSNEFKERLNKERKRIKSFLYKDELEKNKTQEITDNDRIYIFISSSMPEKTLKSYIEDLDHLKEPNITMVLRGFIDGMTKVKPTLEFIENLVTKDTDCDISDPACKSYRANIDIDPMAFRHFNIEKVPAVVFAENVSLLYPDKSIGETDNLKSKGKTQVFYGDMPLEYIFKEFAETNPKFDKLITKLNRKGFYFNE